MQYLKAFLAALPDFFLAGLFLATWIEPKQFAADQVRYMVMLVVVEFIIIHSSAFVGVVIIGDTTRRQKLKALLGLTVFYSLFIFGFSMAFKSWWPAVMFLGLTLNRVFMVFGSHRLTVREKERIMSQWALSTALYVVLAFATAFLYIPQLGISGSHGMTGSGLWEKQPYRPLAFGFIYFLFQALVRLARPALDARKAEKEKRKERYG